MANLTCSTKCGTDDYNPPKSYELLCGTKLRKNYGARYFALLPYDVVIPDPTDKAAWQALIDAGTLCIGPCGKIDLGTPSVATSTDTNNCGDEEVLSNTYTPQIETYNIDPDLSHCQYFEDLSERECDHIIIFDCDGNVYLTKEYRDFISGASSVAPTTNPGFKYSLTTPPYPAVGDDNFEKWIFGITIKLGGSQIMCPTKVPFLLDCLKDSLPTAA